MDPSASSVVVFARVVALVESRRADLLDQLVSQVLEAVPRYELFSGIELRDSLGGLLDALLHLLRTGDRGADRDALHRTAERRVAQGFTAADSLRALFVVPQTVMRVVHEHMPADASDEVARFSRVMQDAVAVAGNAFVASAPKTPSSTA